MDTSAVLSITYASLLLGGDIVAIIVLACRALPPWRDRLIGVVLAAGVAVLVRFIVAHYIVYVVEMPWLKLVASAIVIWRGIHLFNRPPDRQIGVVREIAFIGLFIELSTGSASVISFLAKQNGSLIAVGLLVSTPFLAAGALLLLWLTDRRLAAVATAAAVGLLLAGVFYSETGVSTLIGHYGGPDVLLRKPGLLALAIVGILERMGYPVVKWACLAVVGMIAGEAISTEPVLTAVLSGAQIKGWMVQAAVAIVVVVISWIASRQSALVGVKK